MTYSSQLTAILSILILEENSGVDAGKHIAGLKPA